jgi:hypothetical protein
MARHGTVKWAIFLRIQKAPERDVRAGIATGYALGDQGVRVRDPVGSRIFF